LLESVELGAVIDIDLRAARIDLIGKRGLSPLAALERLAPAADAVLQLENELLLAQTAADHIWIAHQLRRSRRDSAVGQQTERQSAVNDSAHHLSPPITMPLMPPNRRTLIGAKGARGQCEILATQLGPRPDSACM